jgi:predicted porin
VWWDDGVEQNVYVGTNFVEQSRFKFTGEAKIDKEWSAGYILELGVAASPQNQWNQLTDESTNLNPLNQSGVIVRKSNWFIKSKTFGQIAVGQNGTATYHLLDDADSTLTRNVDDAEGAAIFQSTFQLRHNGQQIGPAANLNPLRWNDVLRGFNNSTPGDSARRDVIRYDSPNLHGFVISGAWGEDDLWDAAVTYKNDSIGDFSVLARIGYGESTDPGTQIGPGAAGTAIPTSYVIGGTSCISSSTTTASTGHFECQWGGAGATVQHKPTGLFVYGGWGKQSIHVNDNPVTTANLVDPDSTVWFIQPGIERKFFSLGKTNIFGEYRHDDAGSNPGKTVGASINFWQAGIIQNVEAADTSFYVVYQHADGDISGNAVTAAASAAPTGKTSLDSFQEVITGAKINF